MAVKPGPENKVEEMGKRDPTRKDKLYDKFLSVSCYVEGAKNKIDCGNLERARYYLENAKRASLEAMEILILLMQEEGAL